MSKSQGNFFTARDVFEGQVTGNPVHPAVLRFELIKAHYRSNLNFTRKSLSDSAQVVRRFIELRHSLETRAAGKRAEVDLTHPVLSEFVAALADDLNIAGALAVVIPWGQGSHPDAVESLGVWKKINSVLSIAPINEERSEQTDSNADESLRLAETWCRELDAARARKDFTRADEIRKQIQDAGFEVRTNKDGTTIQRMLA